MAKIVIAEIIYAINYCHDVLNIIYRDLKPENILVKSNGHIKLSDFGLCCEFNPKTDDKKKSITGTIEYIAPEMISN